MARNTAVFVALVAALVISSVSAATHQVGDSLGWTVPGGAVVYSTWASNNTFNAGDTLVFTFTSGQHDVAEVTKEAFDACNATNPINKTTASPANLTLTSGEHYYICTFGGHCTAGQKLAVNVTGTSTPSPSPAPTMTPPTPSPAPVPAPGPSPPAPSSPAPTATPPGTTTPPSPTTPTTPSPASDVTPPPSPNAATSLGVAGGLSATFLAIAAALFMF